ncbi:unnamed protein product [Rhizoctonia solani]|uniref:Uncharacterized protein n=1 Tax=Rhizoctonia solani TaxID=456999 RepID=A0A8H3BHR9_9AGAM|nr:unnamed protein product [Rhizoctonia solani]
MSPLIPTNLSNSAKEGRRLGRPNTWSPLDYPEFVWEGMPHNVPATDERLQPKPDQKTTDKVYKKVAYDFCSTGTPPSDSGYQNRHGAG